jgi:SpoVK/Ycf46/Vps4 family AAA+-type ATPase
LFSGLSESEKNLAVEVIASELNIDVFRIDLSLVVSKYIVEKEKNLNRIFKDADSCNAALFFDEADALFGKRDEIKDAHDRYSNNEVNYLLQKMEDYKGIVILATNSDKTLGEASPKKMSFIVDFPSERVHSGKEP